MLVLSLVVLSLNALGAGIKSLAQSAKKPRRELGRMGEMLEACGSAVSGGFLAWTRRDALI
jgi:hypothetical protein